MKNTYVMTGVVALVVAAIAFFGGLSYQKSKDSLAGVSGQDLPAKLQSLGLTSGGGGGGFAGRGGGRRVAGGAVSGNIISKDDQSITVKSTDGSSKIIYISGSTTVSASTAAAASDLAVGKQVIANGTPNSDGSIAAQTIQIRPAK